MTKTTDMGEDQIEGVHFKINFKPFAITTVSLPALSLLFCFITGIYSRFQEVNETVCGVSIKVILYAVFNKKLTCITL